ncbi:MAG: hypothetical protein LUE24_05220 [Lachnospiraceae bacterium]|nr:hypothetical protein [Lachnospiraceae bacterium]
MSFIKNGIMNKPLKPSENTTLENTPVGIVKVRKGNERPDRSESVKISERLNANKKILDHEALKEWR